VILSISSDIESFKSVRFHRGLNILLADLTNGSTEGHTRNSAGKSSLVEIFHFLLGGDADKKTSLFKAAGIAGHSFTGILRIRGRVVRVTRRCDKPRRIYTDEKRARRLGLEMQRDDSTGEYFVPLDDWKDYLGWALFGLPRDRIGTAFDAKYAPAFRRLFGYFARRSRDIGFAHVDRFIGTQSASDAQIALSYLLGLDWQIPVAIKDLKERQETLGKLRKAIKEGELGNVFGTSASIRPELARAEERIQQLKRQSDTFEVLESYRDLAEEASTLKAEMSRLALALSVARETITHLERLLAEEKPPAYAAVHTLYEAAGIELPQVALRRFEDVQRFQTSVVENRRSYLREQIAETNAEIEDIEREAAVADKRRSEILMTLQGKGAFEDLMRIHDELGQASSRAETLRQNLQNANILENKTAEAKKDSADLELRLQKDYETHGDAISAATRLVDHAIAALYDDRTGNLLIEPKKTGPTFTLSIDGGGNQGGIDQMKVFCFDMMLFERVSDRLGGPHFLVHDSHLFDGVDPRQTRSALVLGREVANRVKGQYIVTMNSDKFEKMGDGDTLRGAVLATRLTDDEEGGLFGFRFELPTSAKQ
jgi:uncharacterized protein YydD (DUF2326 family)